jgi:hypothetical protein
MPLRKITPGKSLDGFPADTFNSVVDAVNLLLLERVKNGVKRRPNDPDDYGIWTAKNTSGSNCGLFGVLGIDTPLWTPGTDLLAFKNEQTLSCSTPTTASHTGKFCIALDAIPAGECGPVAVTGLLPVQVTGTGTTCDVKNSDSSQLQAGSGSAQIVWADTGTGTRWALVRIGGGGASTIIGGATAGSLSSLGNCTCNVSYAHNGVSPGPTVSVFDADGAFGTYPIASGKAYKAYFNANDGKYYFLWIAC